MAEVRPFRGVRYAPRAGDFQDLVCPPYDVISAEQRADLAARSDHNFVGLELPETDGDADRYRHAARLYDDWLAQGVLVRDAEPSLYIYSQRYRLPGGVAAERFGFFGALKLAPYRDGVVLPHEETSPGHREDRYRLLAAAKAQLSPIFAIYPAAATGVRARLERWVADASPATARDAEGVEHRLWALPAANGVDWLAEAFGDTQVFIADGHHRYETALHHQAQRRAKADPPEDQWYDFVHVYLVEMDDPGLVLLPTHRLANGPGLVSPQQVQSRVESLFEVRPEEYGAAPPTAAHEVTVVLPGRRAWRLKLRDASTLDQIRGGRTDAWRQLDVVLLHHLLLPLLTEGPQEPTISYTRDAEEAWSAVAAGERDMAFLQPPLPVDQMKAVASGGDLMPSKSTYFWPKALAGLVVYDERAFD